MKIYDNYIENNESDFLILYVLIDNKIVQTLEISSDDFIDLDSLQEIDFTQDIKIYGSLYNSGLGDLIATITKDSIIFENICYNVYIDTYNNGFENGCFISEYWELLTNEEDETLETALKLYEDLKAQNKNVVLVKWCYIDKNWEKDIIKLNYNK